MIGAAVSLAERAPVPDAVLRAAIQLLVGRTDRGLRGLGPSASRDFARDMAAHAIAEHAEAANAQHYELPTAFFAQVLGPHLKYSSCYYEKGDGLAAAEARALTLTCSHADLHDGQNILELGCGWGSLTLWMADRYRNSHITAVSNSSTQQAYITQAAQARGLSNVRVITADVSTFDARGTFDRVVSVEMFEHLANWPAILRRVRPWLRPQGRLFLHVFAHDVAPYRFDQTNRADFIAQHFFTGGIMPSHDLIGLCTDAFAVEDSWRWSGQHYAQTARDWLRNYDANQTAIRPVLDAVYGREATIWQRRWRLFFLATEGLFGHRGGEPWGISHYRLKPI